MLIPFGVFSAAGAGGGAAAGAYELISTNLISTNTASITFDVSLYAATYKHLQIRATARSSRGANNDELAIRFNSDTGSNYVSHYLVGVGAVASGYLAARSKAFMPQITASTATGSVFGGSVIDILDPFSSSKNTTIRGFGGQIQTEYSVGLHSSAWLNTAPVTSITLLPDSSTNFVSGSRFSLYGIKG